jgi:AraC family transcriptional regulator
MIVCNLNEMVGGNLDVAQWRRSDDTTILNLHTQVADYVIAPSRMALVCAWNGRQEVNTDGRRIWVDDDTWLLMPAESASVRVRGSRPVHALTILFRSGMPEEVLSTLINSDDRLLESGESLPPLPLPFATHLRTHDRSVTPVLLFIRRHCDNGVEDPMWYEEQLAFLLERMLVQHRQTISRVRSIPARRAATRREIMRRVCLATDFIHSNYERPLMLQDIASAAYLSRHHFLRLFKHVHDVTPHEYLQRKRSTAAARLLRGSELAVEEIVKQVGFDSRSTLFRALRRFHGTTPRECRHSSPEAMPFMAAVAQ